MHILSAKVILLIVCSFFGISKGKKISGVLTSSTTWKYLSRFCFLPEDGTLQFKYVYSTSFLTQNMLLYWDKPQLWEMAYKGDLTCEQREALLDEGSYQIFRLHPDYGICRFIKNGSEVLCDSREYKFKSRRERWWYLVISNCASKQGLQIQYELTMRNGPHGNVFREHFSADELYILEANIAFFSLQLIMMILTIIVSIKLVKDQLFHSTYKIFLVSVILFFISTFIRLITYLAYGISGYKNEGIDDLSDGLYAVSTILMVLMLMLLSLGYTVTCGRLPTWGTVLISISMTAMIVGYVSLYIVELATFDEALVLYKWETGPGYGLIGLMLAAWMFYFSCCIYTIVRHSKKRVFYLPMIVFYTIWFIAVPVTVIINIVNVPDHMRAKVVNFVELGVLLVAHMFYLLLTWPSRANKNFPFHIRTTQIDVITFEDAADQANPETDKSDAADGTVFTDFSIFTVSNQPANAAFGYPARSTSTSAAAAAAAAAAVAAVDSGGSRSHPRPQQRRRVSNSSTGLAAGSESDTATTDSPGSNPTSNLIREPDGDECQNARVPVSYGLENTASETVGDELAGGSFGRASAPPADRDEDSDGEGEGEGFGGSRISRASDDDDEGDGRARQSDLSARPLPQWARAQQAPSRRLGDLPPI